MIDTSGILACDHSNLCGSVTLGRFATIRSLLWRPRKEAPTASLVLPPQPPDFFVREWRSQLAVARLVQIHHARPPHRALTEDLSPNDAQPSLASVPTSISPPQR